MAVARPTFNPSRCNAATDVDPLRLDGNNDDEDVTWTPLITCPADFPVALVRSFRLLRHHSSPHPAETPFQFEHAVSQLIHHPEYNSTLILRSEVIQQQDSVAGLFPDLVVPALRDLQPVRNIHRKLLPRRPTRDPAIEQHCTLYAPSNPHLTTDAESTLHPTVLVLVLTPLLPPDGVLPYYHPTVTHLAFRFIPATTSSPSSDAAAAAGAAGAIRIEVIPLPGTSLDPGARLYRTCLSLLETLHRYGWGTLTQYKKRVLHDVLVPRETYQDLYLVMRERHKHLINEWREVTDPLKHVFEVRSSASPLQLDQKALIHDMIRTHHRRCHTGHRHRDVSHASLERHLRSRNHPSRLFSRRHAGGSSSPRRGTLAPLAAPSRRLRRHGLRQWSTHAHPYLGGLRGIRL